MLVAADKIYLDHEHKQQLLRRFEMTEIGRYLAQKMQLEADAAKAEGIAKFKEEAVKNMYNDKVTFDVIAKYLGITELEVINILKNNQVITMLPPEPDLRSL
jgi:hypothetical protein